MPDSSLAPANFALIVGASGGIGREFVRQLLDRSPATTVFAACRHPETAIPLQDMTETYGDRLACLTVDVTDELQIEQAARAIADRTDRLHLAVNCVGILHEGALQPEKSLRQIDGDRLLRYFHVNSVGTLLLAKHLLPLFKHGDRSVFATISAKVGSIGDNRLGGWYGYRASKAALNMFVATLAIEYGRVAPQAIAVALHPGTTDTALSKPFHGRVPPDKLFSSERSAGQLLAVIDRLTREDSGKFFSWDGSVLPW